MQEPNNEGLRWLLTLIAVPFAGGIGFLVKHFLGRKGELTQLGLQRAQTEAVWAQMRREDESAEFEHMRALAQEARADVQRLREERDKAEAQVKILEHELEQERAARKLGEKPGNGKGN